MRKHLCMDLRGFLKGARFPREYRGAFRDDDGRLLTPEEARDRLIDELAKGTRFLPVGTCDNFDPKWGCLGHEDAEARG